MKCSLVPPPPSALRNSNSCFPPTVIAVGGEWQWCCVVSAEEPIRSGRTWRGSTLLQQQPSSPTTGTRGSIAGFRSTNGAAEFFRGLDRRHSRVLGHSSHVTRRCRRRRQRAEKRSGTPHICVTVQGPQLSHPRELLSLFVPPNVRKRSDGEWHGCCSGGRCRRCG
jgi:hypothetical protein